MSMQQALVAARGPKAGPFRAERTKPVAEAPGNRQNHPAATRIGASYGESRLRCLFSPNSFGGYGLRAISPFGQFSLFSFIMVLVQHR